MKEWARRTPFRRVSVINLSALISVLEFVMSPSFGADEVTSGKSRFLGDLEAWADAALGRFDEDTRTLTADPDYDPWTAALVLDDTFGGGISETLTTEDWLRKVLDHSGALAHVDIGRWSDEEPQPASLRLPTGQALPVEGIRPSDVKAADGLGFDAVAGAIRRGIERIADITQEAEKLGEYVIFCVASKGALDGALEKDPGLFEEAFINRVILTDATDLDGIARAISRTWVAAGRANEGQSAPSRELLVKRIFAKSRVATWRSMAKAEDASNGDD
jgi:hypothetical protein